MLVLNLRNPRTSSDPLSRLPIATAAAFNSIEREHDPLCLENTRVDVLHEISTWATGQHKTHIFWLNGAAGTGKSTIARTLCRKFSEQKLLGASFFFSRGQKDASSAQRFFTTIARQLAIRYTELREPITKAIELQPDVGSLLLQDQWTALIEDPLRCCKTKLRVIVVLVDALDECEDDASIRRIITLLLRAESITNTALRIVVTSRPEVPVRTEFRRSNILHRNLILHDVPKEVIDADIRLYLRHELSGLAEDCIEGEWPSMSVIDQLVHQSAGLFIYAATVCLWVAQEDVLTPDESLLLFLNAPESDDRSPLDPNRTGKLDQLYLQVLQQAVRYQSGEDAKRRLCECIRRVLGWIAALQEPVSLLALSHIVEQPVANIRHWLKRLHSVVKVPADDERALQFYHPSFRDFVLDQERCTDSAFLVDLGQTHQFLSQQSLKMLSAADVLHRDMCDVRLPDTSRRTMNSDRIHEVIQQHISYTCSNWIYHTVRSHKQDLNDNSEEHRFLKITFLYWVEVLAWVGRLFESITQINSLISAVVSSATGLVSERLTTCYRPEVHMVSNSAPF